MEKLNIAELLKDCPSGMELDCTMFENVTFEGIKQGEYPIIVKIKEPSMLLSLTKTGCWNLYNSAKCVIFPKDKTTWEGFQRPFKDGEIVACDNPYINSSEIFIFKDKKGCNILSNCYLMLAGNELNIEERAYYVTRLATEEEKQTLFQAIKDNGYKWNPETKTLEKLKFDITTLKPFESRVLVRDYDHQCWRVSFFGYFDKFMGKFDTVRGVYIQCIPYEGNEHLLGTTDDCDEFYKT